MADTPRVTVPVEPEYTATDYLRLIAEGWEVIESTGSQMTIQNPEDDGPQDLVIDVDAMLSAAPAPEGGAVLSAASPPGWLVEEDGGGWCWTKTKLAAVAALTEGRSVFSLSRCQFERQPFTDSGAEDRYVADTYATREEAPAEAGEDSSLIGKAGDEDCPTCHGSGLMRVEIGLHNPDATVETQPCDRCPGLSGARVRLANMARDIDLGLTPLAAWPDQLSNPISATAKATARDIGLVLSALRAQPQAREEAGVELVSNGYKFDEEIAWLREASRYFAARETKGEDRAHWANVYNAENARKLADRLAELSSNPCQLAVATSSEASPCPFCGCGMRVNYDPESEMYGPDGDHLPGCIIGNWDLHEYAFRPDALAAWNSRALRAQPQAREEAQPVAWRWQAPLKWKASADPDDADFVRKAGVTVQPLYTTPPAPEAEKMRILDVVGDYLIQQYGYSYGLHHPVDRKRILAALQQEGR